MSDSRRAIDVLLSRVADEALRAQIQREFDAVAEEQPLGLVFEDHLPEAVRLVGAPVSRNVTVQYADGKDDRIWDVTRVSRGLARLSVQHPDGTVEKREDVPVSELVVARRLGDPVYPGFTPLGSIERGGDKPHHLVIQGENYHALQTLQYTHAGKVDLIYIDPPYNTGAGDWIYNDKYIGDADTFRHSKWLSFMHRRLELAKQLLARTGVIIVAIDDNEHHRLRMLMDQVFGERNFLMNAAWQGGSKNDVRFSAGGLDYMVIYGRDADALAAADVKWRVEKEGLADVLEAAADAWERSGHDSAEASRLLSAWWGKNKGKYDPGLGDNVKIDTDGTPIKVGDLSSASKSTGFYDIPHPVTGKPVPRPKRGWAFAPAAMQKLIDEGRVLFGPDHTYSVRKKTPLHEMSMRSVVPSFYRDRRAAGQYLQKVLGTSDFPFPKDVDVIARWVGIATAQKPDAVVLDFFAGTGTTAEAVMRLNSADGGSRQSIIVTNNELAAKTSQLLTKAGITPGSAEWEAEGVYQKVTRPRVETVVTGIRGDGSKFSDGLDENVTFLRLDYLDRDDVEAGEAYRQVAELLWAKAGAVGPIIAERDGDYALTDHYAVCFNSNRWSGFVDAVNERTSIRVAYIVAASETGYGIVKRALREDVKTVHLYDNYLTNFEINTGDAR